MATKMDGLIECVIASSRHLARLQGGYRSGDGAGGYVVLMDDVIKMTAAMAITLTLENPEYARDLLMTGGAPGIDVNDGRLAATASMIAGIDAFVKRAAMAVD